MARGRSDNETIANVTMTVYYTREVARTTDNIDGLIESIVAKTNQGYINSGVKMRVIPRCRQLFTSKFSVDTVAVILSLKR